MLSGDTEEMLLLHKGSTLTDHDLSYSTAFRREKDGWNEDTCNVSAGTPRLFGTELWRTILRVRTSGAATKTMRNDGDRRCSYASISFNDN